MSNLNKKKTDGKISFDRAFNLFYIFITKLHLDAKKYFQDILKFQKQPYNEIPHVEEEIGLKEHCI